MKVSLRAFAKAIGVSHTDVEKAVKTGRLKASVGYEGSRPVILDVERAKAEWSSRSTRPAPNGHGPTLVEAQRKVALERARKLKIDNDLKRGKLVWAAKMRQQNYEIARQVRDAVLSVPDRLSHDLAAETDPAGVFRMLDVELRRALEAITEMLTHGRT